MLWKMWQTGLSLPITLPLDLPPLRMLLIWDNLRDHYTTDLLLWLFEQGIMPLYTPLGGSWLNMAESIQRILFQRGLAGQHPESPDAIITSLEAVARAWNQPPISFEWGVNALLAVSAADNAGMPWAALALTLAARYIVIQPLSNNGNTHANRPTRANR